jgi:hypothetical protein
MNTEWEDPSETKAWNLDPQDGNKTVYAQFKNYAGLESEIVYSTILLDTTPPTGSIVINNNQQYTTSNVVELSAQASDGQGSGVAQMRFRNQNGNWQAWTSYTTSPTSWTLTQGEGNKRVYVQFRDNAGNISPEFYDEITLATQPPSGSITINQGANYTTTPSVTLQVSYSDNIGVSKVRYSNNPEMNTEWEDPSETKAWNLDPQDGNKTVYAQFKNYAGLESEIVYSTILLDTTPPTGSIVINNNAAETTVQSVTLTLSASDSNGVIEMRFSNDGDNWSDWESYGTTKNWNLTFGLGVKTVFAQFKDAYGLISATYNDTIRLVAPSSPSVPSSPSDPSTPVQRGNIIVYVKDQNNNPVNGATVTSGLQPTGQQPLSGTTDSNGAVTFENVVAGYYSLSSSKSSFNSNVTQVTVGTRETISVTINLYSDLSEFNISLTLIPDNLEVAHRVFIVTIDENFYAKGMSKITLYVNENPVATWASVGTHNFENVYGVGKHTYYLEMTDDSGNSFRIPSSENWEFSVSEAKNDPTPLWKLIGVILVIALGTAIILFSLRHKD